MKENDLIIIGAGASGLMAALSANENGIMPIILEKNNRIGKKILVTGNGRCNYTNVLLTKNDYNKPDFVEKVLSKFGPQETVDYFESLGIVPKIENDGKTYPMSEQASSFLDVFLYELNKRNIKIELNQAVTNITKNKDVFAINTVEGKKYFAKRVIFCVGGSSMPLTGSNGSGYEIVERLGHNITHIFPALVKLKLESPYLKQLSGVKINSQVDLMLDNEVIQSENGDILFTNYGISGPTILELSRKANELINLNKKPALKVILIQNVSKSKVIERFENAGEKEIGQGLIGLLNKRFINVLIKEAEIEKVNLLVNEIPKKNIYKLIDLLYDWRFVIKGSLGFEESQVTAGGINLDDVDNLTLESKIIKGLYFAGEILDIDGRCGGYNLQWAWSSGYVAGKRASKSDEND